MPSVTFQRERVQDLWAELEPLLETHYREIAAFQDIPLAPDKARYEHMEVAGALRVYVGRRDGQMVAYCVMVVQSNAHYRTSLQAAQDILYVDPDFRRGRIALRLIEFVEQELRQEGVQVVHQHSKIAHPALGKLLDHMGYSRSDTIHTKRLD